MKILILRFSSIGDVLQCLSVAGRLRETFPQAEIHWVTRADLTHLVESHPAVHKVWPLSRQEGFKGLLQLGRKLRQEQFTHIYDAHNNLRSHILSWLLVGPWSLWGRWRGQKFVRRSIYRWRRFLLFRFRRNLFPQPFSGQRALLEPLTAWGVPEKLPATPQLFLSNEPLPLDVETFLQKSYIALAPSAAYQLKRWPLEHWADLIRLWSEQRFVILGGPEDRFLSELVAAAPERVLNTAGQLNLVQSAQVVSRAELLIANDTGLMHVAEQLGRPCVALMGPAPFGFPSRPSTRILERTLPCRPCSKHGQGPCVNPNFHECLRSISPAEVKVAAEAQLRS